MQVALNLLTLVRTLSKDLGLDSRDVKYVITRLRSEGLQFLTITLPKLVKCVLRGLELGSFKRARDEMRFTHISWQGSSLRYFRSLLSRIFAESASDAASALWTLRQACEYLYKLALPFTSDQLLNAEMNYDEQETRLKNSPVSSEWAERLRRNFETYYPQLARATVDTILKSCRPRPTSGSVAGASKFQLPFSVWKQSPKIGTCDRSVAALSGYFKPYPSAPVPIKLVGSQQIAEVLFVPKDSRGPRVISKEPYHRLLGQMSYFDFVSAALQKITHGRIQFTDQSINQRLAKEASVSRTLVTADLKDASDSVRHRLVKYLFKNAPGLRYFIRHFRTPIVRLPVSGSTLPIEKLAGMGSGLTFPTMALLIHLSICTLVSLRGRASFEEAMLKVYVYGDDLIAPREWWDLVQESLALSGLKVNIEKTFVKAPFRESCGGDYLHGIDVTPVRLKLPAGDLCQFKSTEVVIQKAAGVLQLERHCRELITKGLVHTAEYLYKRLETVLGKLPNVSGESPYLGRYDLYGHGVYLDSSAYFPITEKVRVPNLVCPYKYLGKVLARPQFDNTVDAAEELGTAGSFGEIALPRKIQLIKKKRVSHHALYGQACSFTTCSKPVIGMMRFYSR